MSNQISAVYQVPRTLNVLIKFGFIKMAEIKNKRAADSLEWAARGLYWRERNFSTGYLTVLS